MTTEQDSERRKADEFTGVVSDAAKSKFSQYEFFPTQRFSEIHPHEEFDNMFGAEVWRLYVDGGIGQMGPVKVKELLDVWNHDTGQDLKYDWNLPSYEEPNLTAVRNVFQFKNQNVMWGLAFHGQHFNWLNSRHAMDRKSSGEVLESMRAIYPHQQNMQAQEASRLIFATTENKKRHWWQR